MNKLMIAKIGYYFCIIALLAIIGLSIYLITVDEFTSMIFLRGIFAIALIIWGVNSFHKVIEEAKFKNLNKNAKT